ncbi:MAG: hypothetical protein RLZZ587_824, partial [Actinomycetota bacterium]
PAMVLAHYGDGIRRGHKDHKVRVSREALEAETARRERHAEIVAERRVANGAHPSIAHIAEGTGWTPPKDGRTEVRAGTFTRDGVHGFPWLVDAAGGIAVVGEGPAADAIWRSLVVSITASHGESTETPRGLSWPSGVRLVRGDLDSAGITIRCAGNHVHTVTRRGCLPESGDWAPDATSRWREVLALCQSTHGDLEWADRSRCPTGVGLADGVPFVVDLTSIDPHVLVCGRTGTGKSEFLAALLCDWVERFTPAELSWVGFDFKGGAALGPLESLPHCRAVVTDLEPGIVRRAFAGLSAELTHRERALRRVGVSRIDDTVEFGRLVVVVDEFPELVRRFPMVTEVLADIARRGRSLGVHLVLTTQHVNGVHRDGLAANIPVRVCFPLSGIHDVTAVIGAPPVSPPGIGRPVIVGSDGHQNVVHVRVGATPRLVDVRHGDRQPAPWLLPLQPPLAGKTGFGLIDDVIERTQGAAEWSPPDGDIVVVGNRGSGRSTALIALVREVAVTQAENFDQIAKASGVVVIDDLDRIYDELADDRKHALPALLASRRLESNPPTFVIATTQWSPRLHGLAGNVLVLGMPTRDAHAATGEPMETFDPSAKPGVGSWRGRRVVIYASTDSIVTDAIP